MRKSCVLLSAAFVALQSQVAFSYDLAQTQEPPRSSAPAKDTKTRTNAVSNPAVAQTTPVPAAGPSAAATLPAERTETINFENWILTCREFLEGARKRTCAATVAVQRSENGQMVIALSIQLNEQGKITAAVQTPSGVAIAPGVDVKFEKATSRRFAFDFCEPSRCSASMPADTVFIRDVSAATSVTISLQASDGKPVNFEFPMKGFEKAYAKMTKG
jgi:invasion protein IalB